MDILTEKIVFNQLESSDDFPIDFDDARKWLGIPGKANPNPSLLNRYFVENEDFIRTPESIRLSIDCFKQMAMLCNTAKGKWIRRWYLQIEKEWRMLKTQSEVWVGILEKVNQMGYPLSIVSEHRSHLIQHVAALPLVKKREYRQCYGVKRPIVLYRDCLEFEEAIRLYMAFVDS